MFLISSHNSYIKKFFTMISKLVCLIPLFFLINCSSETATFSLEEEARASLRDLYVIIEGDEQIIENAAAILIIPKITSASFFVGGSYGEGVLFIKDAAVEQYSLATASYGLEVGASQFSQALIFMTSNALKEFRTTDGWELSADANYTYKRDGKNIGVSSNTLTSPIFELIYGQNGLSAGASLKGAKYSRLIR